MFGKAVPAVKTQTDINTEWDQLAATRHRQIVSHVDTSYHGVLVPSIIHLCGTRLANAVVLDVGCGTGELTHRLARTAARVVGVDPSEHSISIARKTLPTSSVEFSAETIEDYAKSSPLRFDVAIANMTLMDCLDLDAAIASIGNLLKPSGIFVGTITHPWNWPRYRGYDAEPWFDYKSEIVIEAPFRITAEATPLRSTHIHRPLERYVEALALQGLAIQQLLEPIPNGASGVNEWEYPRYLAIRASCCEAV